MPMTTRPRRTIVPSRRRLDMEMDSDVDMEDQPEPEEEDRENDNDNGNDNEDPEPEEEDAPAADEAAAEDDNDGDDDIDEDEDDEDDQEDEIQSENDGEESQPAPSSHLRIRLKMPAPASRSAGTETPGVESEDSMDSHPSTSTAAKPMTTRQAVLASMVDSTHVSLGGRQSKKKVLNESEIALRREETARKRKNMTEKKLEDEKLETINRLLKKQSRPRNKRGKVQKDKDAMDDVAPSPSVAGMRANSNSNLSGKRGIRKANNEDEGDDEDVMDEDVAEGEKEEAREVRVPTMYRWISTSRVPVTQGDNGNGEDVGEKEQGKGKGKGKGKEKEKEKEEKEMRISFSVPVSALPTSTPPAETVTKPLSRPTQCAVPGCGKPFKYRLVKDWTRGACGITCLKTLQAGP